MVKLYAIELTRNVAFSIDGKRRQNFKKGDKVLVGKEDRIAVLRLGAKILGEKDLEYSDVFGETEQESAEVETKQKKPKRGGRKKKAEVETEAE